VIDVDLLEEIGELLDLRRRHLTGYEVSCEFFGLNEI